MTAGYRGFRLRDEDPNDHAAVAAMQARSKRMRRLAAMRPHVLACVRRKDKHDDKRSSHGDRRHKVR
jgi:hypothetical protein